MVKNKGKILSEELWNDEKARKYAKYATEKDFNLEKKIDQVN